MLIDKYSRLKEKCDQEYKRPTENNFTIREFDKIRWYNNSRNRNFFTIIKILAENGYCMVNEITYKDGLSQTPKNRKKRHDVYHRLIKSEPGKIKGELGRFEGLIDKGIVEVEYKKNWETKRKNRYRLSTFGVLYAIRLFTIDPEHTTYAQYDNQITYKIKSTIKYKKNILEVLAENYSDLIPLIFGNWEFMTLEFGNMINFLVGFACLEKEVIDTLHTETFLNPDIVDINKWQITDSSSASKLSILLIAYMARQDPDYTIKFAKDKKILDLYKTYIRFLKKKQYFESLRIKYQEAILYGKHDKAKKIAIELEKA